jgi:hypothetical protein
MTIGTVVKVDDAEDYGRMNYSAVPGLKTRQIDIGLTVIGLCGLALVFTPFALDYVPILDIDWTWQATPHVTLVLPCIVLPPAITLGYVVWHVSGRLPGWATAGGFILAAVSASAFLAAFFRDLEISDPSRILFIGPFLIAFTSAAWLCTVGVNKGSAVRGLIAMQCIYATLIVFAFAMAIFWDRVQIGGWLGAVASFAYLAQVALALRRPIHILVMLVPLALIGLIFTGMQGGGF